MLVRGMRHTSSGVSSHSSPSAMPLPAPDAAAAAALRLAPENRPFRPLLLPLLAVLVVAVVAAAAVVAVDVLLPADTALLVVRAGFLLLLTAGELGSGDAADSVGLRGGDSRTLPLLPALPPTPAAAAEAVAAANGDACPAAAGPVVLLLTLLA